MDLGLYYGTTVKVAPTDCNVLTPVRAFDEMPTAMEDVKVKVSAIIAGVRLTNSVMVFEMLLGAIVMTFECRRNESPVLPVPVTVNWTTRVLTGSTLEITTLKCPP